MSSSQRGARQKWRHASRCARPGHLLLRADAGHAARLSGAARAPDRWRQTRRDARNRESSPEPCGRRRDGGAPRGTGRRAKGLRNHRAHPRASGASAAGAEQGSVLLNRTTSARELRNHPGASPREQGEWQRPTGERPVESDDERTNIRRHLLRTPNSGDNVATSRLFSNFRLVPSFPRRGVQPQLDFRRRHLNTCKKYTRLII